MPSTEDSIPVKRRSQLYRRHVQLGARFMHDKNSLSVDRYEESEHKRASNLALSDLSMLPRIGFKGSDVNEWLKSQNINIPSEPNQATFHLDGSWMCRLSKQEFMMTESLGGKSLSFATLHSADVAGRVYKIPRADSHAWLSLSGTFASVVMSKLCAVDLSDRTFRNGSIAQTSLARVSAVILRADLTPKTLNYHIFSDSTSIEFLWDCLSDAMLEFRGVPVGVGTLRQLYCK
tara:strand:+ start:412 stop:1110 length:699 start_codon:yes stop_codon:yes gene_type:complete